MSEPAQTLSLQSVAKLLMISDRRVQQLAQEGFIPKASHGQYPVIGAVQGYIRYLTKGQNEQDLNVFGAAKSRRMAAQAELAEMAARRMRGELIPAPHIRDAWTSVALYLRSRLLAIPEDVAALVIAAKTRHDAKEILKKAIYEALEEISRPSIETGIETGEEHPEPLPPAA